MLITESTSKVAAGSEQVEHAGQTMSGIVAQVQRVREMVDQISAWSSAQADGIGQVGDAVVRLDQDTQQNAALVEQSSAAATSLNQLAAGGVGVQFQAGRCGGDRVRSGVTLRCAGPLASACDRCHSYAGPLIHLRSCGKISGPIDG